MTKKKVLVVQILIIVIVASMNVLFASGQISNTTKPELPTNDTEPIPTPPPEIIDYELKYGELLTDYEEKIKELELIIENNPIVYFKYVETLDNDTYIRYSPYHPKYLEVNSMLHNPAYGEDSDALGQHVDNFIDLNNISVIDNLIRNSTYNAINLIYDAISYEDFDLYTEIDEDGDITILDTKITINTLRLDANTYVYYDFGIGNLDDFSITYMINITDVEAGDGSAPIMQSILMSNFFGKMGVQTHYICSWWSQWGAVDDYFKMGIREKDTGVTQYNLNTGVNYRANKPYYVLWNKTGNNVGMYVYNDEAMTSLNGSVTTALCPDNTFRYLHAICNKGQIPDPADYNSGSLHNLAFAGGGYRTNGYFTTINYLSNPIANGSTLVYMTNSTIPSNTGITVQFSSNNSTWVNNLGVAGYNTLTNGFLSIDLRNLNYSTGYYVMVNETTTDTSITPMFYQSRLITTEGNSTGGAIPSGDTIIIMPENKAYPISFLINLFMLVLVILAVVFK